MTLSTLRQILEEHKGVRKSPNVQGYLPELIVHQHDMVIEKIIEYLEEQRRSCHCENSCPVHGISAQLDRTQME